jgi:hypothetical protein
MNKRITEFITELTDENDRLESALKLTKHERDQENRWRMEVIRQNKELRKQISKLKKGLLK